MLIWLTAIYNKINVTTLISQNMRLICEVKACKIESEVKNNIQNMYLIIL